MVIFHSYVSLPEGIGVMWPPTFSKWWIGIVIQGIGDLLRQGRLFSAQCELEQLQPLGNASDQPVVCVEMPEIFVVFFLAFVSVWWRLVKVGEGFNMTQAAGWATSNPELTIKNCSLWCLRLRQAGVSMPSLVLQHTLAQKHLIELLMWNASYVQKTLQ